jgi:FkbM family methyltransferase
MLSRFPLPVRLAQLVRALPDFAGRDTLVTSLLSLDACYPDALIEGTFADGLRFAGNPARDRNTLVLALQRYCQPALAAVLEATLGPGGVLADVGGHLGMYALWAARRVGPGGRVHSFEPDPKAAESLRRNAALNGFAHLEVNELAVGAEPGRVRLVRPAGVTGLTSRYAIRDGEAFEARVTTLDLHFAERRPLPDLVKIDVEGMEHEVLRGARGLLSGDRAPAVVFEANPVFFEAAGTSYRAVLDWLAEAGGYGAFALGPGGLRPEPAHGERPGSLNVLALRSGHAPHDRVLERLRHARFPKNLND